MTSPPGHQTNERGPLNVIKDQSVRVEEDLQLAPIISGFVCLYHLRPTRYDDY